MTKIAVIPLSHLALMIAPMLPVAWLHWRWCRQKWTLAYATVRMLTQLGLIGFVLTYLFAADQAWVTLAVLAFMMTVAATITVRPLPGPRKRAFTLTISAMFCGCVPVLALVVGLVLPSDHWHDPAKVLPLAGMIFANAMNTVALAAERFASEGLGGKSSEEARGAAFNAALIPLFNSLFAVGLVSLPGMMTGQILAGVDPLIAARYQILVMMMLLGSSGLAAAIYLRAAAADARGLMNPVTEISAVTEALH